MTVNNYTQYVRLCEVVGHDWGPSSIGPIAGAKCDICGVGYSYHSNRNSWHYYVFSPDNNSFLYLTPIDRSQVPDFVKEIIYRELSL